MKILTKPCPIIGKVIENKSRQDNPLRPFPAGHKKEQDLAKHHYGNLQQIFILAFDALRERKARSILTILMVITGGGLMVALNGMSAGVASLINKQLSILAPNVLFVSPGQINFRGGPSPPSTLIFNLRW